MPQTPTHSTAQLVIRAATPTDVPTVLGLIRALAEYEKLLHEVTGSEAALAADLFGDRPFCEALIAEYGGESVGFALFFSHYDTATAQPGLYLEDLFVLPTCRGLGVGKALLRHLGQQAIERGLGQLVWSVLDWNEPAIAFYRRMGADIFADTRVCRAVGDSLVALAARSSAHVRPARPGDWPAIAALAQAEGIWPQDSAPASTAMRAQAHLSGDRPHAQMIVSERDGQIDGMAIWFHNYSTFLTKPGLYLDRVLTGAGFPEASHQTRQALFAYAAQQALALGCGRLESLVSRDDQEAIAHYQQLGMAVMSDWRICQVTGAALSRLAEA
ncbi:MAG TPA: GNAT family N-acetyltransferase [Chroococcidiopsis sp.]